MKNSPEKKWLVKSHGRVLGPFCTEEVVNELKAGEIEVEDEIAVPQKIWRPIRDVPEFGLIVEELRVKKINEIDEDTPDDFTLEKTLTSSEPVGVVAELFEEEIKERRKSRAEKISTKTQASKNEIVYEMVEEKPRSSQNTTKETPVRSYGYKASSEAHKEAQGFSKFLWGIAFFITVGVAFYLTYTKVILSPQTQVNHLNDVKTEAKYLFGVGEYKKSFVEFQKALEINPDDLESYVFLGILFVGLEGQSFEGKRYLQESLNKGGPNPNDTLTGLGFAFLLEEDYSSARSYFLKAQQINGTFSPALVNLGVVEHYLGNYAQAEEYYLKAIQSGIREKVVQLLLAKNYIDQYFKLKDQDLLTKAKRELEKVVILDANELQEALLMLSYIDSIEGNLEAMNQHVQLLLDLPPNLSKRFVKNLYIDQRLVSWNQLFSYCERVLEKIEESSRKSLLEAFCYYKDDKLRLADRKITEALNQNPQQSLAQAHYAFIKNEMGEDVESSVAVGNAVKNNRSSQYILPFILQAELCFANENYDCAEDNWKAALLKAKARVVSLAGLAQTYFMMGQKEKSKNFLQKTFEYSSDYSLSLKLAYQLEKTK